MNTWESNIESLDRNDPISILVAIKWCKYGQVPLPAWALDKLADAAQKYTSAEARTFDDALGLDRRKGFKKGQRWLQAEAEFDSLFGGECYLSVMRIKKGNKHDYADGEIFDVVAMHIADLQAKAGFEKTATAEKVKRNFQNMAEYLLSSHQKKID